MIIKPRNNYIYKISCKMREDVLIIYIYQENNIFGNKYLNNFKQEK